MNLWFCSLPRFLWSTFESHGTSTVLKAFRRWCPSWPLSSLSSWLMAHRFSRCPSWQKNHICHALIREELISWGGFFEGKMGILKGQGIEASIKFPVFFCKCFEGSLEGTSIIQIESHHKFVKKIHPKYINDCSCISPKPALTSPWDGIWHSSRPCDQMFRYPLS